MEETTITKAEKMVERMLLSLALQDAINAKAIRTTPEQERAMDEMIADIRKSWSGDLRMAHDLMRIDL